MINSPCKNCEERHLRCWSECGKYKEWNDVHVDEMRQYRTKRSAMMNDERYTRSMGVGRKGH